METVGNSGLLEETRRVDNFRVSSGKIKGSFRGLYFNDSDVYKWIEAFSFAYAWTGKEELVKMAENVINEVVAAQEQDGYKKWGLRGRKASPFTVDPKSSPRK